MNMNKLDDPISNEICLYLFNGKCCNELCKHYGKSCVLNSGESCVFFMKSDTFKKYEEQETAPLKKCYFKNDSGACTNKYVGCSNCDIKTDMDCPYYHPADNDADNVNHPNHYTKGGIECIKAIEASMTPEEFQAYCKGNVMKYIWRFRDKNGLEDLKKAQVYLGWMIESKAKQEQNTQ